MIGFVSLSNGKQMSTFLPNIRLTNSTLECILKQKFPENMNNNLKDVTQTCPSLKEDLEKIMKQFFEYFSRSEILKIVANRSFQNSQI